MKKINENTFQISENLFINNYNENNNNLTVFNTFINEDIFFLIYNNNDLYQLKIKENELEHEKIEEINKSNIKPREISFTQNIFFLLNTQSIIFFSKYNLLNNKFTINQLNPLSGILEKKKIKKISCNLNESLFLTYGGNVYSQKDNPILIIDLLNYNIENIYSGGNYHIVYGKKRDELKGNDYIFAWGDNSSFQCGISDNNFIDKPIEILSNVSINQISLGEKHSVILTMDSNLFIFGDNTFNQCFINSNDDLILLNKEKIVSYNYFNKNNENIIKIQTSFYSTLFITDNNTLLTLGKINNKKSKLYKIKKEINIEKIKIAFSDNHLLIINNNEENIISPIENTEIEELQINKFSENNSSFDDLLEEQNPISLDIDHSDNSYSELKSYINLLSISFTNNYHDSNLSFRPDNLPKKSKEEEEIHRKLVHENREKYKNKLRDKQILMKENMKKLEDKHNKEIEQISFWKEEIIPNWTSMKLNKNFKKYFYKGVPNPIRGQIWLLSIGNKFSITKDYYDIEVKKSIELLIKHQNKNNSNINNNNNNIINNSLLKSSESKYNQYIIHTNDKEESIHLIDLDIERTYCNLNIYKNNSPMGEDLREILRAYVISRPDIGYIQGLSYIAGTLLLQMEKFQSFVCLMNITLNPSIICFFRLNEKNIKKRLDLFNEIFNYNLPKLYNYFCNIGILSEHFFIEWTMTLFAKNLNLDITMRVWDIYLIEGIETIYKGGIVILSYYENEFYNMEFEEIIQILQKVSNLKLSEDEFINKMSYVKFNDKILSKIALINEDYFSE